MNGYKCGLILFYFILKFLYFCRPLKKYNYLTKEEDYHVFDTRS